MTLLEKISNIDCSKLQPQQIKKLIVALEKLNLESEDKIQEYFNKEQAVKLVLNSLYGSFGNFHMLFFNTDIVEAITLEAKETNSYAEKVLNYYFQELWHKDTKLHEKLGIKVTSNIKSPCVVYQDTDSGSHSTIIRSSLGILTFEELFNELNKTFKINKDKHGNEILNVNSAHRVLNFNKELKFDGIKKIVRHKVTKAKWKLKSKSGKEVIVTGDHSLIVFRNQKRVVVKPNQIKKGDKVLTVFNKLDNVN